MAKSTNQKLKTLFLLKILYENTDENHGMTMGEIVGALAEYGVQAERKSLYDDISLLRDVFGVDIIMQKGVGALYYIGSREFELSEVKLLVDCVQSSQFITEKKSEKLIKKLETLTSRHNAGRLQRQVYISGRTKSENETIYYNIDKIQEAITANKKISFMYTTYTSAKKIKYRNDGKAYVVSPYALNMSEEKYYLISHYSKHEGLTHFRVDRMEDIRIVQEERVNIKDISGEKFDLAEYSKRVFSMYGGKTEYIRMRCDNSLISSVIDRFGSDVIIYPEDEKTFVASIRVEVSPTFYSWLFTFGTKICVLEPENVIFDIRKTLADISEMYKI